MSQMILRKEEKQEQQELPPVVKKSPMYEEYRLAPPHQPTPQSENKHRLHRAGFLCVLGDETAGAPVKRDEMVIRQNKNLRLTPQ